LTESIVRERIGLEWWLAAIFVSAALLLGISLLTRPINHDEGQYVGAIALMRSGLPYRDFAYLQTPLQPLVLAPLSFLSAGWLLVGARVANALFGWLSLALLLFGLRGRTPHWAAIAAVVALGCSDVFLFGCSVARNDALPMLLLSAAVALVLQARTPGKRTCFTAGLLLGLATSAKISFALPAAAAGLFLLSQWRETGGRPILLFAAGGLAGLLPTAILALFAPEQFYFDVFTYSLEAPQQWWASVGHAGLLTSWGKLHGLLKYSLNGAILSAILVVALDRRRVPRLLLLDCMIVGGLITAYLPTPAFRQYLLPLLPPLFARLAITLGHLQPKLRRVTLLCLGGFSIAGLSTTAANVRRSAGSGSELVRAVAVGRAVAQLSRGGAVATLAPELVGGSNVHLDHRFVTGPFLFRTHGALAGKALRLGFSPNWQRVQLLRDHSPSAIVLGTEAEPWQPMHPHGLDWYLERWARDRNYSEHKLAGGVSLFLAPNVPDE
jgi:glycosyl transferase family 87